MGRLLFLSHSGIDTEAAKALKARLLAAPVTRDHGLGVWFDKDDLRAGEPWQSQLEDAIGKSHAFAVYVGSKGVVNWVEAEVRLALNRAITEPDYRFVPILAGAAPGPEALPGFARQFQGVLDVEGSTAQFEKLMRAVLGGAEAGRLQLETEPFFGLRAIDESRSHLFFGRGKETEALVALVHRTPLVLVTGDSGSGKSSLVRAGLVPRFRGGALALLDGARPEDTIWHVVTTQPRNQPFRQLGDAVGEAAKGLGLSLADRGTLADWAASGEIDKVRRGLRCDLPPGHVQVLLVVDQFEELLTITPPELRSPFIDLLLDLSDPADGRHRVVLTMRHDYANLYNAFERLKGRLDAENRRARFLLGRMSDEGLRRIVTEPLCLAAIGPADREALASEVLRDVGERPGDLALVQMALTESWRARSQHGGDLLRAYADVGRVEGALARAAERVRAEVLDAGQRELLDSILLRLVRLGDTGGATRRVASRGEFDDARWSLIQKLASEEGKRLLLLRGSTDHPTVEIAHEALVTAWPYFQNLLQDTADDKRVLDTLIPRAQAWATQNDQRERDKRLTTGADLELFAALDDRRAAWLAPRERDHLQASRLAALRRQRVARLAVAALVLLTIAAGITGGVALWLKGEADAQAKLAKEQSALAKERRLIALVRQLSAQARQHSLEQGRPVLIERGAALAVEALRRGAEMSAPFSPDVDAAARDLLARLPYARLDHRQSEAGWRVTSMAWNAEGDRLATSGAGDFAFVWAANGQGQPVRLDHGAGFWWFQWNSQGDRLATGGATEWVKLWSADGSGAAITLQHERPVSRMWWSPLGDRLTTLDIGGTARLWSADGQGEPVILRQDAPVKEMAWNARGDWIATLDENGSVTLRAANGQSEPLLLHHGGPVELMAWSPLGGPLATVGTDNVVRLWPADGQGEPVLLQHCG